MIRRLISPAIAKSRKSILLLGPRQVGKSTLINGLNPDLVINLADELEYLRHSSDPGWISQSIELANSKSIFIDEVQRLPKMLNTVQALIDNNKSLKFYLTGSSARKLKRGEANLLPGRILNYRLGPLVAAELDYQMDTERALAMGTLPEPYLISKKDSQQLLVTYAANYLQEEIKAEALTRNLDSFARFLTEASVNVGQFIDLSKMAKKAKISRHAVPRYFEILEDTLIGSRIFPYPEMIESQDLIRHPKFYLFDNGVYNGMMRNFVASPDRIGSLAEQLIFSQIFHSSWAKNEDVKISTFRTRKGIEVDFIVENQGQVFAIEVKGGTDFSSDDFSGLEHFKKEKPKFAGGFLLHMGTKEKKLGSLWSMPWQQGIRRMGL